MTFQTLDYIIAIAEEKSISKAADRLLLSQPALSRQLKRVEESLDTKLFAREQNEMHLTDAGKIYVNGARSIQNIYERALNDIRKLSQSGRHQITFIYNNILLPDFSTEILPDFRKLHPDIVLAPSTETHLLQRIISPTAWPILLSLRLGKAVTVCWNFFLCAKKS